MCLGKYLLREIQLTLAKNKTLSRKRPHSSPFPPPNFLPHPILTPKAPYFPPRTPQPSADYQTPLPPPIQPTTPITISFQRPLPPSSTLPRHEAGAPRSIEGKVRIGGCIFVGDGKSASNRTFPHQPNNYALATRPFFQFLPAKISQTRVN